MKTVLIIGCNGFIGRKLVKKYISEGYKVVGVDIATAPFEVLDKFNFNYFQVDYNNLNANSFSNYEFDLAYHLAWCGVSTIEKNDLNKQLKNVFIAKQVLEFCKAINLRHLVIAGSMSEFSKYKTPVNGKELDSPSDLYAATKCYIRKFASLFCEQNHINLNYLLITSIYSYERKDSNLITSVISHLKLNQEMETTGLEQQWDYIHIDDLIEAMFLIGIRGKQNCIYPIGSGTVKTLRYYIDFIIKCSGKNNLIHVGALPYKNTFIDNSIPDVTELFKLGFSPKNVFEKYIFSIMEDTYLNGK